MFWVSILFKTEHFFIISSTINESVKKIRRKKKTFPSTHATSLWRWYDVVWTTSCAYWVTSIQTERLISHHVLTLCIILNVYVSLSKVYIISLLIPSPSDFCYIWFLCGSCMDKVHCSRSSQPSPGTPYFIFQSPQVPLTLFQYSLAVPYIISIFPRRPSYHFNIPPATSYIIQYSQGASYIISIFPGTTYFISIFPRRLLHYFNIPPGTTYFISIFPRRLTHYFILLGWSIYQSLSLTDYFYG